MSRSVIAVYDDAARADLAIERLLAAGFRRDDISLMVSDDAQTKHFGIKKGNKATEGVGVGSAVGGTIGAIAAGLTAAAGIVIPGIGLAIAGPLIAALAGAGAGGAAGGIIGGLVGAGFSEHEAKLVEEHVKRGNIVIGVTNDDRSLISSAKSVLKDTRPLTVS